MHHYLVRFFIRLAVNIFRSFFSKRITIALNNIKQSNITSSCEEREKSEIQIIYESLDHLALTVYRSIERLFTRKRIFDDLKQEDIYAYLNRKKVHLKTEINLETLIHEKRGMIFVSAHIGAWEDLIDLGQVLNKPTYLLSKRMKIKWLQSLWEASRTGNITRLDQGFRAKKIIDALNEGSIIADVLDQHCPSDHSILCNFLGRQAATSPDLSRFALITNALIIPIFLVRTRVGYHQLYISDIIDPTETIKRGNSKEEMVKVITQQCCDEIEKVIRLHPEQWMWIHRRWKVDD